MAKARGVDVLCGEASFLSNKELQIEDKNKKTKILFDNCIIASGSRSSLLPIVPENNNNILTSKTALDLSEIPDSLLVVVLPRVAMVVFVTVACYSALQVQLGAEDNLYIYASAAAILTIMSYMSFLSLRRDKKRLKEEINTIDPYDL